MSNEYLLIQEKKEGLGEIAVSYSVIDHIVSLSVDEEEHVFLANKKAVQLSEANGDLIIGIQIQIQYGQNVEEVCSKLQSRLQRNLNLMIDFHAKSINLAVVGFKFGA